MHGTYNVKKTALFCPKPFVLMHLINYFLTNNYDYRIGMGIEMWQQITSQKPRIRSKL